MSRRKRQKYEIFRPGQMVTWSDRGKEAGHLEIRFGLGPFVVVDVEDVPCDMCGCGTSFHDKYHRMYHSNHSTIFTPLIKQVGHPQWVKLAINNDGKEPHEFSGAYLKAA